LAYPAFAKAEGCSMRFDFADLSLFRHVVEAGSITHGAERAHLALAAASTRIRNMEEALGAALLVRGRQGVTPTQAGRTLLQHARTILRQTERLREDLSAYAGGLAGQIRVLSNTNALTEFLPEALSSFLAAHPNVSVDLEEKLSDEIVGQIAEGVADLGIVAATVDVSELETYPFRKDRFVLAVAHDHPLAKRSKIAFAEVLRHDFVGLDRASALQRFLADKAARSGDQGGGAHRRLGGAGTHNLHPPFQRAAALCPPIGRASARRGDLKDRRFIDGTEGLAGGFPAWSLALLGEPPGVSIRICPRRQS
jgi:DNA-binding transcriptional LysR family regulator